MKNRIPKAGLHQKDTAHLSRLKKAALLAESEHKIYKVANMVGYTLRRTLEEIS